MYVGSAFWQHCALHANMIFLQAINPARDFGPRLFSAIVYGSEVFTSGNYYFVVPIFAPVFGCIVGATVYDSLLYEGEGSRVTDAVSKLEDDRNGALRLD